MPELPEVETIRRGLARSLPGRRIAEVQTLASGSLKSTGLVSSAELIGATVCDINRRGKLLIIGLDSNLTLLVHLRMTGQLIFQPALVKDSKNSGEPGDLADNRADDLDFAGGYPSQSLIGELPGRHTRVIISFTDGSKLFFNDQRKFGYLKLLPTPLLGEDAFLAGLGPEPLADDFTWQSLRDRLPKNSNRAIKAVLLDQHILAGIGNIYADESLFAAGIHPETAVRTLGTARIKRLHQAIRTCLQQSLDDGGSTARDYVDSEGLRGEYLDLHAQVYNRTSEPCPLCGRPITKTRVAGRGTHLCTHCQRR